MTASSRRTIPRAALVVTAILMLALVGRLTFSLVYWVDRPLTIDQEEYLLLAENLRIGLGLSYGEGDQRLMRSPGYPVFLAGVMSLWNSLEGVRVVQSLLGTLGVFLVGALAYRLAGTRSAYLAAAVAALYPPLVWMPAYILSETLFMVLALLAALLLWRHVDQLPHRAVSGRTVPEWSFLGVGALLGLAVLTRPEILLFVALVSACLAMRRHWSIVTALALGTLLVVVPWTATNYLRYNEFILVSSRGGPNFWLGNSALALGDGGAGASDELRREYTEIARLGVHLSPSQLERVYYQKAFTWVAEHPGQWLVLEAKKLFFFWVPVGPSYSSHSRLYWVGHAVSYLTLLPFAAAGAIRLLRRTPQPYVLWALVGSTLLTSLIFFPLARYRIPLFDTVMIVCAASLVRDDH